MIPHPPPHPPKIKNKKVVEVRVGQPVPPNSTLIHISQIPKCPPIFYYECIEYVG